MSKPGNLITGVVIGAGAMYLLDPDRGARRRSLLRDQGVRASHKVADGMSATARDARNRAVGAAAELRSRFRRDQADDDVLQERVRAAVGRVVSHPSAVQVTVSEGAVTLSGDILEDEVEELVDRVRQVRGVSEVRNELVIHRTADGVPALQGAGRRREQRPELLQENWAPATRLLVGTIGGMLAVQGTRTRGEAGVALGAVGLALVARAATNLPPSRLVGIGAGRRAIELEKTITIAAPVEQVWELWSNFENFPRFMTHLREVRKVDETRSHWVAVGPAGVPVEWDAIITEWVPRQFIAWKSVNGSTVQTAGMVRFRPIAEDQTEIDVRLSYNPPGGAVGHAIAFLSGTDPKRAMDEDMVRVKSLLEEGKTRADGEPVRLEEVASSTASNESPTVGATRRQKTRK
jgi:uncharacterized membrane protein